MFRSCIAKSVPARDIERSIKSFETLSWWIVKVVESQRSNCKYHYSEVTGLKSRSLHFTPMKCLNSANKTARTECGLFEPFNFMIYAGLIVYTAITLIWKRTWWYLTKNAIISPQKVAHFGMPSLRQQVKLEICLCSSPMDSALHLTSSQNTDTTCNFVQLGIIQV